MKRIFQIIFLMVTVALILDLRYQGKSSRTYALEFLTWAYKKGLGLSGKNIEELAPRSIPSASEAQKLMGTSATLKTEGDSSKTAPNDFLTEKDREDLKNFLKEKILNKKEEKK